METKIRYSRLPEDSMCSLYRTGCDWDKRERKPDYSLRETGDRDAFDSMNESANWSDISFLSDCHCVRDNEMSLLSLPEHEEYEARNAISRLRILKEELSLKEENIVEMKQELNNEKREKEQTLSILFERNQKIQLLEREKTDDNWEIENLHRTNRRQGEELKHFRNEIVELENKLSTLELQIRVETELKLQINDYGWQLNDLEQQKRDLLEELNVKEDMLKKKEKEYSLNEQNKINENEHSLRKLSEKNSKSEDKVQPLQKEKNLTEKLLYEEESKREKQSQEISRSERKNQELETENRNLRIKKKDHSEKLLQTKTSSVIERKESMSMRQILPRTDNEKSSYKAIEEMQRRLCEKKLEIQQLQQDKNTLMADLNIHQQKSEKLQEEIGLLRGQNELYRKQLMQEKETAKIMENEYISLKKITTRTQEDTPADEVQKQLREENTELKRKIEQLNQDKKNLAEELRYEKETEKKTKSHDISKQQDESRNLQKEVDRLRHDNRILNNKLRLELENFHVKEQTLKSMQHNVEIKNEEISKLKAEVENQRQMNFELQTYIQKVLQENKNLTKELAEKREMEESTENYANATLKGVSQILQDDVTKLRIQNQLLKESLRQEKEKYKQIKKETKVTNSDMQRQMEIQASEVLNLKQKLKEISGQKSKTDSRVGRNQGIDQDMQKRLEDAMAEVRRLQIELDGTKSRLSTAMGDMLKVKNSNIADLSDRNRPTKIAQRYQELFDNQWTDAFEIINATLGNEGNTINALRIILMDALEYCETQAAYQMKQIKETFLKGEELPAHIIMQVKECRKAIAEQIGTELYQDYCAQLNTSESAKSSFALKTPSYVQECFEICWLMAIQDPPILFGPVMHPGDAFNKDLYEAYTRIGDRVEYFVLPVLLLHQNGPVLCKGVAEGK